MREPTVEEYLEASKAMLALVVQRQTDLSAEAAVNLQEAIEFIDRTRELRTSQHAG